MKSTIKIALAIALFCSATFAEGQMTTTGLSATGTSPFDGKITTAITKDTSQTVNENDFLVIVRNFLTSIFG